MFSFNDAIEPLWIFTVQLKPEQKVKNHAHAHYFHFLYVRCGSLDMTINNRDYVVTKDMFTIAKPGEYMGWQNNSGAVVETYEMKFSVLDEELYEILTRKMPPVMEGSPFTLLLLEKIFNKCVASVASVARSDHYQDYMSIYITTLLYDIVKDEWWSEQPAPSDGESDLVASVKKYIAYNYEHEISMDDMARAVNYNKSYLSTTFKKKEGVTINDFLYRFRIHKSCELIAYKNLSVPISEISAMVGFKHVQHFNRTFKKYMGIPPGEYRDSSPKECAQRDYDFREDFDSMLTVIRTGRRYKVDAESGYFSEET